MSNTRLLKAEIEGWEAAADFADKEAGYAKKILDWELSDDPDYWIRRHNNLVFYRDICDGVAERLNEKIKNRNIASWVMPEHKQIETDSGITNEDIAIAKGKPIDRVLGVDCGGRSKKIRCINPEHDDRNPSMNINIRDNYAYCFSCGYQIDSIQAEMVLRGLSFKDVVKKLIEN